MIGFPHWTRGGNPQAALAQLVEQHFCKVKVPSSNLGSGSKIKPRKGFYQFNLNLTTILNNSLSVDPYAFA